MSTPHAPKPLLPKIKDFANGTLPAAPHDHVVTADVLDVMLNEGDSVTLSISGSNFFKVARATVYDVDWEVIDSSELPRGHHGPVTAQQELRSYQVSGLRTPSTTWRIASITSSG